MTSNISVSWVQEKASDGRHQQYVITVCINHLKLNEVDMILILLLLYVSKTVMKEH